MLAWVPWSAAAYAGTPIGPHQHFAGQVNGTRYSAEVRTVCAGPGSSGSGSVASGQTVSVIRARKAHGYTGVFNRVYAWFVPAPGGPSPTQILIKRYKHAVTIPTSIQVPCDGTGKVEFSSCPYLAPCAAGWVPAYVKVTFVDVAA